MSGFVIPLTPIEMLDALSAANDKSLIFQQDKGFGQRSLDKALADNQADGTNDGGQLLKNQPLILDADIAITGAKIEIPYKTGNAAMTRSALGSVNIGNGIQVLSSALYGMEWFYRNFCQDPNPTIEPRNGTVDTKHIIFPLQKAGLTGTDELTLSAIPNTIKNPVQIRVEFQNIAAAAASGSDPAVEQSDLSIADGNLYGKVSIEGTGVNGEKLEAELRLTKQNITDSKLIAFTPQYFKTITKASCTGVVGGTIELSATDNSKKITFTPQDLLLRDFFSLEYAYGGLVPFTFRDLMINTINGNISRDTAVVWGCGVLGTLGATRENIAGEMGPTVSADAERASTEVFSGTECYIEVDGRRLPAMDATITGDQGYVNSDYLNHSLHQTGKPKRNGKRSLQISVNLQATLQNDYNRLFFQNAIVPNVKFVQKAAAKGTYGKYDATTTWTIFQAEVLEAPSISSSGNSAIPQTLVLGAFNNNGRPEFNIVSEQPQPGELLFKHA